MSKIMTRVLRPAGLEEALALIVIVLTSLILLITAVHAHGVKIGALELHHPWTRATAEGANVAGGFLVIHNTGAEADRLIGGTADFADKVEIHEMTMDGDVMKMRMLENGLELPAGSEITLKPGSYHVMFTGLKHGLTEGTREKGTLVFEKAGTVEVEWAVDAMGAGEPHHGHTK